LKFLLQKPSVDVRGKSDRMVGRWFRKVQNSQSFSQKEANETQKKKTTKGR